MEYENMANVSNSFTYRNSESLPERDCLNLFVYHIDDHRGFWNGLRRSNDIFWGGYVNIFDISILIKKEIWKQLQYDKHDMFFSNV